MKCPFCAHGESKVTDSRNAQDANTIRRRRECMQCGKRFTTFETVDLTIQVKKRDGQYQEFQLNKMVRGLDAACRHTRISHDQLLGIASEIAEEIYGQQIREIDSVELGERVMNKLKALDMIAYIRFACVYRRFKDKDELIHAIEGEV